MEQVHTAKRDGAVDLAKALAICAVLLIHCSAGPLGAHEIGSFQWLASIFCNSGARWAVPAFLLCSGALMNDPDRALPVKKLLTRYLLRLFLAYLVWGSLYEGLRIYMNWGSAPLWQLLANAGKNFLHGDTYYHLYYFYLVIALYLALPLTRLAARAGGEELRYILALWLLLGIAVRFLQYFWPVSRMARFLQHYLMPAAVICPGLGLLGWYLRRRPPGSWRGPLLLFLTGFSVTFLATWRRSAAAGVLDQLYLDGFGPFAVLMAAGVFRLCQRAVRGPTPRFVRFLSQASFCVYLVHPFFQWLLPRHFVDFGTLPPAWAVPLHAAVLLGLSLLVYLVLRQVPWVKSWLI